MTSVSPVVATALCIYCMSGAVQKYDLKDECSLVSRVWCVSMSGTFLEVPFVFL